MKEKEDEVWDCGEGKKKKKKRERRASSIGTLLGGKVAVEREGPLKSTEKKRVPELSFC